MPRDVPSAQTQALQKIQLQSMRERLKLDSARARQAVADAPSAEKLGPMGRPVVRYKDMPAMDDTDMDFMAEEFHRMACPHVAVLEYRPGYGERGYTPEVARECWWFFERGMDILFAVADAVLSERMPDLFTQLSTEELAAPRKMLCGPPMSRFSAQAGKAGFYLATCLGSPIIPQMDARHLYRYGSN